MALVSKKYPSTSAPLADDRFGEGLSFNRDRFIVVVVDVATFVTVVAMTVSWTVPIAVPVSIAVIMGVIFRALIVVALIVFAIARYAFTPLWRHAGRLKPRNSVMSPPVLPET